MIFIILKLKLCRRYHIILNLFIYLLFNL
jgi:hypothetical protein